MPHRATRSPVGYRDAAMTAHAPVPGALEVTEPVLDWYAEHARVLPWRSPTVSPWGVLVSEVMLQQTRVARVLPVWEAWLERWPTPAALAGDSPGEAVRAWGRLGYPRRALRLHAAARAILDRHGGDVPSTSAELLALPGVGEYTAAAVASFAFRQRHVVLDTNVRRVLARCVGGEQLPPPAITRAERARASALLPQEPEVAATWAVAVMELGALVCTAVTPRCAACPVADRCRWRQAGFPPYEGPERPVQQYAGTDRQCRGRVLEVLRTSRGPVHRSRLEAVWQTGTQLDRCLAGLVTDGLAVASGHDGYGLPDGFGGPGAGHGHAMSDETPGQLFEAALHRLDESGDPADILARFADGAELHRPELDTQTGLTDAESFWSAYRTQFDELSTEFTHRTETDEHAALEWESKGRLSAGRDITYRGVSLLTLDPSGKVTRFATYYDTAAFLEPADVSGSRG